MADRRPDLEDSSRVKRQKVVDGPLGRMRQNGFGIDQKNDPSRNPYLAHHYSALQGMNISRIMRNLVNRKLNYHTDSVTNSQSRLRDFKRRTTTAKDARVMEDGPQNPFTGQALSQQYMSILKTRRGLPVHAQR